MHSKLPAPLTKRLSSRQRTDVAKWWQGLDEEERSALRPNRRRWPSAVIGRFVEPEPSAQSSDEFEGVIDFYEYLVNHEISLEDRSFHICSAHPRARAVLAAGRIPADYSCPRADAPAVCPMRALLDVAPGRDLVLTLRRRPPSSRPERGGGA